MAILVIILILIILIILLPHIFVHSISRRSLIKLYETLKEYHMPCEVVLLRFDFFKMAVIAMETAKMLKN